MVIQGCCIPDTDWSALVTPTAQLGDVADQSRTFASLVWQL